MFLVIASVLHGAFACVLFWKSVCPLSNFCCIRSAQCNKDGKPARFGRSQLRMLFIFPSSKYVIMVVLSVLNLWPCRCFRTGWRIWDTWAIFHESGTVSEPGFLQIKDKGCWLPREGTFLPPCISGSLVLCELPDTHVCLCELSSDFVWI